MICIKPQLLLGLGSKYISIGCCNKLLTILLVTWYHSIVESSVVRSTAEYNTYMSIVPARNGILTSDLPSGFAAYWSSLSWDVQLAPNSIAGAWYFSLKRGGADMQNTQANMGRCICLYIGAWEPLYIGLGNHLGNRLNLGQNWLY